MQASKLSCLLGEAQVLKALLDVASQRAAFLLHDSSCLLVSLAGAFLPSLLPPSFTDICFLRLRHRSTHQRSSCSSQKSDEITTTRSHFRTLENVKSKLAMAAAERSGDPPPVPIVRSVDPMAGSVVNESLLFLALKPAKVGISTDLRAWRCTELGFFPIFILFGGSLEGHQGCSSTPSATVQLDIPHGNSVGIVASVNVVVVHSRAINKLWVFSGKCSSRDHRSTGSGCLDSRDSRKHHLHGNGASHGNEEGGCLHLIKCAVVDCNGPLYSIYLSLQHLLVGQLGGVRVWLLRPLIKGSPSTSRGANHNERGICTDVKQDKVKSLECQEFGYRFCETYVGVNGQDLVISEGDDALRTLKGSDVMLAVPGSMYNELGFMHKDLKNATSERAFTSSEEAKGLKQGFTPSNGFCLKQGTSCGIQQDVPHALPIGPVMLARGSASISEFEQEEPNKSQYKLSQCSTFSSSSDSSSSSLRAPVAGALCCAAVTASTRSSSCQSLTSSVSSVAEVSESQKRSLDGIFVSLENQAFPLFSSNHSKIEQVTAIHGLSHREFVIVDSVGKLHLLTLQYLVGGTVGRVSRAPPMLVSASLQSLPCPITVKCLAVLPIVESGNNNSSSEPRMLWVSDGCHSVHIVAFPSREASKEGSRKDDLNITVIGTVFTPERIRSLLAVNEHSVMVLTEGSALAYSWGSS